MNINFKKVKDAIMHHGASAETADKIIDNAIISVVENKMHLSEITNEDFVIREFEANQLGIQTKEVVFFFDHKTYGHVEYTYPFTNEWTTVRTDMKPA